MLQAIMNIDGVAQIWTGIKGVFTLDLTMATFYNLIEGFNTLVWGVPMIVLIFSLGIYLTFKLGIIQRHLFKGIKLSVAKDDSEGEVSNFGALAVTIAATVGTGSIIGVTTAIAVGGPGAIFWMIIAGFFGFATKYAECFLSVKYRVHLGSGEYVGGPMYVLANRLKSRKMAIGFAISTLVMSFIAGGLLQANSIADAMREGYNLNPWFTGIGVAVLTAVVVLGGVKRIANICEWLVPIMGSVYLLAAIIIGVMFYERIPMAIVSIFKGAFTGYGAAGGAVGVGIMGIVQAIVSALRAGVSRSVLATEAGLGSASIVAAAAKTNSAVRQALISSTSVFWTILICTITGMVIVLAGD
ncbi:AGCS family alanine or glycine:cation symporter [Elusimicrobium simillimum]